MTLDCSLSPNCLLPAAAVVAALLCIASPQRGCHAAQRSAPGDAIYVSPRGSDAWSGRLPEPDAAGTDGPVATVAKARDRVRALKARGLRRPVTVVLRGGFYPQLEKLVFTATDSGTEACPITWQAYPGERPVISGGDVIRDWQRDETAGANPQVRGKLWRADAPADAKWSFNQLYVNGHRRTRARMPNKGSFFRAEGPAIGYASRGFYYKPGDVKEWDDLRDALFVVYHSWETSLHHVRFIDPQAQAVVFQEPAPWSMGRWELRQRYYVENVFEGLDEPGEWYLDRKAQKLYYYPLPDEDMNRIEAIAPNTSSTLVEFLGAPSQGRFIEHLHFKGLTFAHTNSNLRRLRNPGQGEIYQPALIMAVGLRHSSFEDCEIAHTGAHAIWFAAGSEDCLIQRCHLHDLGGGGVYIGGGWGVHENAPTQRITVDNNFIHDGGYQFHGAHGVWIGKSSYNEVTHNEVSNFDYSGISCGWSWGFAPSSANHNHLDYNHIHHLSNGDGLSDMGGIYTLGVSPGTTERYNHIHDVYNYAHVSHGSGLYPDEGSTGILMENNVVHHVRTCPLFMHYGKECIVRNNILAFGDQAQMRRCREDKRCHYVAQGNIVLGETREMVSGPWKNDDWDVGGNLYWSLSGPPSFLGMDFATWQKKAKDEGSMVADPLFVDPRHGDFRLKPDSPALKLGFKPIDMSRIGLYGDPEWVKLPQQYPNRQRNEVPKPEGTRMVINFDFEGESPGQQPQAGRVVVGNSEASVQISADTAATGKHSLKFIDAPNQQYEWQPHIYYNPAYDQGEVHLSWDMLNSKQVPASYYLEVRQWDVQPYLVGPTVSVDADGKVTASGQTVGKVPPGEWAHVEIEMTLGQDAPKTYRLTLSVSGGQPTGVELPYRSQNFEKITWFGVSSTSQKHSVFYLDNLKLGTPEDLAKPPRQRPLPPSVRRRPGARAGGPPNKEQLVGYWKLDEGEGYVAEDSSGWGNDGDVWGAWVKGDFGTAILCEETGAAVTIPDAPSLHLGESDFSVEMWLCPTKLAINSTDARRRIMEKSDYPRAWWNINITSAGQPFIELGPSRDSGASPRPPDTVRENVWTHLVIVVQRSQLQLRYYLNGQPGSVLNLPAKFAGPLDVAGHDLTLGSSWHPFVGLLDEVKLYKRALTPQEINASYERERARRAGVQYKLVE